MVYIFKNIVFKQNQNLIIALSKIYGVGYKRAEYVCSFVGLNFNLKIFSLNFYKFAFILYLIKKNYGIDNFLLQLRINRKRDFFLEKTYKSIKYFYGLPIRGQSSKTNRKTAKKLNNKN